MREYLKINGDEESFSYYLKSFDLTAKEFSLKASSVNKKKFEEGIFFIFLSASCMSLFGFFVKIGLQEISIWGLTFLRFSVPLLLSLPFLWWNGTLQELFPLKDLRLQVIRAGTVAVGQFCMIYYLTKASLTDATMLWGTGPIFIPIIARFFYGVKIPKVTWWSIFVCFIGVALILKPDRGIFDPFSILGLISGITMALSQTLYGINIEKGKPGENLFFLLLFCSLFTMIPFFLSEEKHYDLHLDFLTVGSVLGTALAVIGNQLFRGYAYVRARPALLTPFLYISVVVSSALDAIFFHIYPDFWAALGFCFVVAGSFFKWR